MFDNPGCLNFLIEYNTSNIIKMCNVILRKTGLLRLLVCMLCRTGSAIESLAGTGRSPMSFS